MRFGLVLSLYKNILLLLHGLHSKRHFLLAAYCGLTILATSCHGGQSDTAKTGKDSSGLAASAKKDTVIDETPRVLDTRLVQSAAPAPLSEWRFLGTLAGEDGLPAGRCDIAFQTHRGLLWQSLFKEYGDIGRIPADGDAEKAGCGGEEMGVGGQQHPGATGASLYV